MRQRRHHHNRCAAMTAAALLALVVCLTAAPRRAAAAFDVETAGGAIISPASARRRFDVAIANFGLPKYGALMAGQLVYPHSDAAYGRKADCALVGCNHGCVPFNQSAPPVVLKREPGRRYIMLLDRGPQGASGLPRPCYFLDKAFHAQLAGADALLVVNDRDGDLSTAVAPRDEDSARELKEITISAGLISRADGERLKALLKSGPVTVSLNWTDSLPKAPKAAFEFWTNSNDECGALCDAQRQFVKDFKAAGKLLMIKGLVDFAPHYITWVCDGRSPAECAAQCVRGGRYCAPDPDDDIHKGWTGVDVLKMNVRSLCFAKVAKQRGEPWLWWDYVDRLGDDCRMSSGQYTAECAERAFGAVTAGSAALGGDDARAAWRMCADLGAPSDAAPLPLLEDELAAQTGGGDSDAGGGGGGAVAILPTVRVNGRQYRGSLAAGAVLRALCAAFPAGREPGVCTETWVSENECEVGGDGWRACNSGGSAGRCINTFKSFRCECAPGYVRAVDKATGAESCSELNECLMSGAPWARDDCKCARCVCANTPGGYSCSGPIPDECTEARDYGGCWRGEVGGRLYHGCTDNMRAYRFLAEYGRLNATVKPWRCACPPCFREVPGGGCEPACDPTLCADGGLSACPAAGTAAAAAAAAAAEAEAARRHGGGGRGGVGFGALFLSMLAAAGLAAGGVYAAYALHARAALAADVRRILDEYVPLATAPPPLMPDHDGGAFGGGAGRPSSAGSGGSNGGRGGFGGSSGGATPTSVFSISG